MRKIVQSIRFDLSSVKIKLRTFLLLQSLVLEIYKENTFTNIDIYKLNLIKDKGLNFYNIISRFVDKN